MAVAMSQLITIEQPAQQTGLSVHTLRKMCSQRRIPHVKLGGAVRFDPGELDKWIKQNTRMPMPEKRT